MTLAQLIAEVGELRPHQYGTDHLTAWVNEIEARAVREVINRACGNDVEWTPYTYDQDADKTLQIPDEHKAVYETYLFARIDYTNGEIERYNADAAMQDSAWHDYAAWYRREHRPKSYEIAYAKCPDPEGTGCCEHIFWA